MTEYLFLMHDDAETDDAGWGPYIRTLQQGGFFEGGSVIGDGICARKQGASASITAHLAGYVNAVNLEHAKSLLAGNPVFEAGGTVEIRELPRTTE